MRKCAACHAELPPQAQGRPRKFWRACVPSVREAGREAVMAAWRRLNPERLAQYNAARRKHPHVEPTGGGGHRRADHPPPRNPDLTFRTHSGAPLRRE
jgi:hypothetical protein